MNGCSRYVVQPNDTLSEIALRQLGRADRWTEIVKANQLLDASRLLIGQQLLLPSGGKPQQLTGTPTSIKVAFNPGVKLQDRPATTIPARAFTFVIADEINPLARKVVRKVLLPPKGVSDPSVLERLTRPEKYGFGPRAPGSPVSMGRHVGGRVDSNFISASDRAFGSPRIEGQRFWIDVAKAEQAGVKVHETETIIADLDRVIAKTKNPVQRSKFLDIRDKALRVDREVLFEGSIPAAAVKTGGMIMITRGAQVVSGVGLVLTAYDLEQAGSRSWQQHSIKPLAAESVRQVGGWAGAWAGAQLGGVAGAAVGIETGPGALVTGLVGGLIGGVAGFIGADWISHYIE
jgi:LysM domain